jgi:hypothetical protein
MEIDSLLRTRRYTDLCQNQYIYYNLQRLTTLINQDLAAKMNKLMFFRERTTKEEEQTFKRK